MPAPRSERSERLRWAALRRVCAVLAVVAALVTVSGSGARATIEGTGGTDDGRPMVLTNPSTGGTTGNEFVRPTFSLSGPCPAATTSFYAKLYGGSEGSRFPPDGQQIKTVGDLGMSLTEAFSFPSEYTFIETAQDAGLVRLAGRYVAEVICQDDFSNVLERYTTTLRFTAPSRFQAAAAPGAASPGASTPAPTASAPEGTAASPTEPAASPAKPAATPRSAPGITATDATGVPLERSPVVAVGETITVRAGGFVPGERVKARLEGGDAAVETVADGNGVVAYSFTVPEDTGPQQITVSGSAGEETLAYRVAEEPSGPESTSGSRLRLLALMMAGVLVLALVVGVSLRRRSAFEEPTDQPHIVGRS